MNRAQHRFWAGLVFVLMVMACPVSFLEASTKIQVLIRLIPVSVETGRADAAAPAPGGSSVMKMLWLREEEEGKVFLEDSPASRDETFSSFLKQEGLVPQDWVQGKFRRAIFVRQKYEEGRIVFEVVPGMSDGETGSDKMIRFQQYTVSMAVPVGEPAEMGAGLQKALFENEFYRDEAGNLLKILLTPLLAG